jgi:hypothetical protein
MAVQRKVGHQVGTPAKSNSVVADDVDVTETDIPRLNLLDELRETLSEAVDVEPYALTVPARPKVSLVFNPVFDFPTFQAWQKKAEDRKAKETDFYKLGIIVLSNTNIGIRLDGQDVDRDGEMLTIVSPEIHKWLGAPLGGTAAAIRKLYGGKDGHVIQAARMIVEKAGYSLEGDVLEADDSPLDV